MVALSLPAWPAPAAHGGRRRRLRSCNLCGAMDFATPLRAPDPHGGLAIRQRYRHQSPLSICACSRLYLPVPPLEYMRVRAVAVDPHAVVSGVRSPLDSPDMYPQPRLPAGYQHSGAAACVGAEHGVVDTGVPAGSRAVDVSEHGWDSF